MEGESFEFFQVPGPTGKFWIFHVPQHTWRRQLGQWHLRTSGLGKIPSFYTIETNMLWDLAKLWAFPSIQAWRLNKILRSFSTECPCESWRKMIVRSRKLILDLPISKMKQTKGYFLFNKLKKAWMEETGPVQMQKTSSTYLRHKNMWFRSGYLDNSSSNRATKAQKPHLRETPLVSQ